MNYEGSIAGTSFTKITPVLALDTYLDYLDNPKPIGTIRAERSSCAADDLLRVWLVDDCDYVAAATLEGALEWYDLEVGAPLGGPRIVEEVAHSVTMQLPRGQGEITVTLRQRIEQLRSDGASFPAIIAESGGYT